MSDDQRLVVNVEEQLAKRLYDRGFPDHARRAVARATSLQTGAPLNTLEASRLVPMTKDELAARKQEAAKDAEQRLREDRDALLTASDWTQLPDIPAATQEAWADYRQKLRDLPAQTKDPAKVKWPTPPA